RAARARRIARRAPRRRAEREGRDAAGRRRSIARRRERGARAILQRRLRGRDVADTITVELLRKMLDRMPGACTLGRVTPATGKTDILYMSPGGHAVYGMTEAEMEVDPNSWMIRLEADDRDRLLAASAAAGEKPMQWLGRLHHPSGELRWL